MKQEKTIIIKFAGLFGLLVPFIVFIIIGVSIYYSSGFSWTNNWLSELAGQAGEEPIWAARGVSSLIFNIGIIVAGLLGIVFTIAIWKIKILNSKLGLLGKSFLTVDMVALLAIGIFPLTTDIYHDIVSFLYFLLVALSLVTLGIEFKRKSETKLGLILIILGIISFSSFPLFFVPQPWGSNAIIEMVPITSLSISAVIFGYNILKGKFDFIENKE